MKPLHSLLKQIVPKILHESISQKERWKTEFDTSAGNQTTLLESWLPVPETLEIEMIRHDEQNLHSTCTDIGMGIFSVSISPISFECSIKGFCPFMAKTDLYMKIIIPVHITMSVTNCRQSGWICKFVEVKFNNNEENVMEQSEICTAVENSPEWSAWFKSAWLRSISISALQRSVLNILENFENEIGACLTRYLPISTMLVTTPDTELPIAKTFSASQKKISSPSSSTNSNPSTVKTSPSNYRRRLAEEFILSSDFEFHLKRELKNTLAKYSLLKQKIPILNGTFHFIVNREDGDLKIELTKNLILTLQMDLSVAICHSLSNTTVASIVIPDWTARFDILNFTFLGSNIDRISLLNLFDVDNIVLSDTVLEKKEIQEETIWKKISSFFSPPPPPSPTLNQSTLNAGLQKQLQHLINTDIAACFTEDFSYHSVCRQLKIFFSTDALHKLLELEN